MARRSRATIANWTPFERRTMIMAAGSRPIIGKWGRSVRIRRLAPSFHGTYNPDGTNSSDGTDSLRSAGRAGAALTRSR